MTLSPYGHMFAFADDGLLKFPPQNTSCVHPLKLFKIFKKMLLALYDFYSVYQSYSYLSLFLKIITNKTKNENSKEYMKVQ